MVQINREKKYIMSQFETSFTMYWTTDNLEFSMVEFDFVMNNQIKSNLENKNNMLPIKWWTTDLVIQFFNTFYLNNLYVNQLEIYCVWLFGHYIKARCWHLNTDPHGLKK